VREVVRFHWGPIQTGTMVRLFQLFSRVRIENSGIVGKKETPELYLKILLPNVWPKQNRDPRGLAPLIHKEWVKLDPFMPFLV